MTWIDDPRVHVALLALLLSLVVLGTAFALRAVGVVS